MSYRLKINYYISETCECGAKRNVKDHGTWVGYYCPSCKNGGSVSKKRKFDKKVSYQHPTFVPKENFRRNSDSSGLSSWSKPRFDEPKVNMDEFMENDEPMSLYEYCKIESGGLEGQALQNYINRYYGHN